MLIRRGLESVHHVRELDSVANEEDGQVISHQVVVAVFSVELDRKAPRIASRVGGASCADDR